MMTTDACVLHGQRDLRVERVELAAPGPGEVLLDIGAGGICGSDLHYFLDGGFGTVRVRQPIILGHEVAGTVAALGTGVAGLREGDRVAVNPSNPCGACEYCARAEPQHCLEMRFWGSAMRMPHVQGGFRRRLVAAARQCVKVGDDVSIGEAAMSEPLAVALHAVAQAGDVRGRRVLVTGFGPIGAFAVGICKAAGAAHIVATDVNPKRLELARTMGANDAVLPDQARDAVMRASDGHGADVVLEMSGVPSAVHQAFALARPAGRVNMLGIPSKSIDVDFAREIIFKGLTIYGVVGRRMYDTWHQMTRFLRSGNFDPRPVITHRLPLEAVDEAMALIRSGEAGKIIFEL